MPLISTKGVYGLSAMYELSKHKLNSPMQIRDICQNTNIPQNYLEQLLGKLRKAGFIKSIRGAKGGYLLAKKPEDILIKEILITLEGDLKVVDCKTKIPALNLFFEEARENTKKIFNLTLNQLDEYANKYNEVLHYVI